MASSDGGPEGHPAHQASASTADQAQSFFSEGAAGGLPATTRDDPLGRLLAAIDPVFDSAMTYFYGHLFAIEPQIRAMFPPAMDTQRKRFYQALTRIVASGDDDVLAAYLDGLGRAHRKFGVQKDHFDPFAQALTATWQRYAPEAWDEAALEWDALYRRASSAMIAAAERDAEH